MPSYSLVILLPLIAFALGILALVVLLVHRMRSVVGLTPLLVMIGSMASVLQFPVLGSVKTSLGGVDLVIQVSSFVFLPVLLIGMLVIYIVEGSTQARSTLFGILAITILAAIFRTISTFEQPFSQGMLNRMLMGEGMRELTASTMAITADLISLVVVYQVISNLHKVYPSLVAVLAAMLTALFVDAVIFTTTSYLGEEDFLPKLVLHLLGKGFGGLLLAPFVGLYLKNYATSYPDSTQASPRPVLDMFTTSLELEARARHNYNLLQTLLKINHLVVRATNLQTLLDQACQLLVSNREYLMVCIYLTGNKPITAWAGEDPNLITTCMLDQNGVVIEKTPAQTVLQNQRILVINHTSSYITQGTWAQTAHQHGIKSLACFPLSLEGQPLGIMMVGVAQEEAFDDEEVELLRELVNDLATAIVNYQVRQAQTTLITAVEMLPDGLIISELSGEIVYTNPAVADLLQVEAGQLVGKNVTSLLPFNLPQEMGSAYLQALVERGSLELDFDLELPGEKRSLSVRAALVYDPQRTPRQIVVSVRDVTSRKQYEHQLLALNRLITDLVQRHSKEELLPFVFSAAEELLNGWASALYSLDPDGQVTEYMAHNLPDAYTQRISQGYRGLPGEMALRTHTPVYVSDVLDDPVYQERIHFLAEYGIRALLVLPILDENRVNGTLVVYYDHPHTFNDEEIQLGMTLAHTVAIALQNLYLYQAEHSQRQFAEGLAQAAASLNRLLNPDEVLDQILEHTLQITPCRAASIMLVEGSNLRLVRHSGYAQALNAGQLTLLTESPLISQRLHSGQPLLISDTQRDPRWSPIPQAEWIRSRAAVPLKVSGNVVGFLSVDSDQPDAFNLATLQRMQALADQASIAIHNADLYSESRRQALELSALVQSAAMVSTSLDINQVLDQLSKQMASLVNVAGCAISAYDPLNATVTLLAHYRDDPLGASASSERPVKLGQYPVTRRVLEEHLVIQIQAGDPDADPAEVALMEQGGVKTLLMLPLVAQEVTLGLVELESVDPSRVFSPREVSLLLTLGANAANAIQNARLYTQLQEYAGQLERRVENRTAELRSAKEHIESILATIPDALFVLDDNFQPIRSNQAGDQLILNALADELDLFEPAFLTRLRKGRLAPEESILKAQGRFYQALASPFRVQPGQEGLIVVFRDVTRFRELDEIKNHFVSDVSHEFRTPLANLILYLDLLASVEESARGIGYIATLQRETQRLGFLIEDLLTISRLEAGRITLAIKPTDVNGLVNDLVNDRTMLASSRELRLTFVPDPNLPQALSDASLLNQAISNLLTNAINYTPAGGSVVLSTHLVQNEEQQWVTIDIADTGVGISAEEQTRIFERFYRGTASRTTGAPGTGLGLAIAQDIAARINGKLSVKSQPGQGSTFTFWLKAVL